MFDVAVELSQTFGRRLEYRLGWAQERILKIWA